MPLRPLALVFVLICVAVAVLALVGIIRGVRSRKWPALVLLVPLLFCGSLAYLPVPYVLGLDQPHAVFNGAAPAPADAVSYFLSANINLTASSQSQTIFAVRSATGKTLWQRTVSVADQHSFVTSSQAVYEAAYSRSSSPATTMLSALDGSTGTLIWQRSLPMALNRGQPLLFGDMLVLAGTASESAQQIELMAVRAGDGQILWSAPVGSNDQYGFSPVQLIPAPDRTRVYDLVATSLEARSTADGHVLGIFALRVPGPRPSIVVGATALYNPSLYDPSQDGGVTAYPLDSSGVPLATPLWRFGDHDWFQSAVVAGDTLYVAGEHDGPTTDGSARLVNPSTVYALDLASGKERWSFATKSNNNGTLALSGDGAVVFVEGDDGIHALRTRDGAELWHVGIGAGWSFADYAPASGSVMYFTGTQPLLPETFGSDLFQAQGFLYAVNAATGALYWDVPLGPVFPDGPHAVL